MKQIMLYTDIARNACGAEKLRSQLLENEGNLVGGGTMITIHTHQPPGIQKAQTLHLGVVPMSKT